MAAAAEAPSWVDLGLVPNPSSLEIQKNHFDDEWLANKEARHIAVAAEPNLNQRVLRVNRRPRAGRGE
jgi:hypothetical protein